MDEREIAEKSLSVDRKMMYNHKTTVSPVKKRGGSGDGGGGGNDGGGDGGAVKRKLERDGENVSRKKSKKVMLLSNLPPSPEKMSEKNAGDVKGRLNSKPEDPRGGGGSGSGSGGGGNGGGLSGIALSLSESINIPKRRRTLTRRKKVEVGDEGEGEGEGEVKVSKQEGKLSDRGVLIECGKVNGDVDDSGLSENRNVDVNLAENGESKGFSNVSVVANGKRKRNSHDHNGNGSENPDLVKFLKIDDPHSYPCNGNGSGNSVTKKAIRNCKKNKVKVEEAKQSVGELNRVSNDSQDDEENLEANAARMLSSRFDPSCTGFPSGGKSPKLPALMSSNRDFSLGCSRDRKKVKRRPKERRRFYAVVYKDLDPFWVLNRRIKVFWPLDKSWYIGRIIGYDQEKNHHHVKYDDREEEWIDLQNERFKLFIFPSEVPGKGGNMRPTADSEEEEKHGEIDEVVEMTNGSSMESEPIISWLARSSLRKSSKKKRTLLGCLEEGSSGFKADETLNKAKPIAENCSSNKDKSPIVYFRRRFHRKKEPPSGVLEGELCQLSGKPQNVPDFVDSLDLDVSLWNDECGPQDKRLSSGVLIWGTDDYGLLKIIFPISGFKVFGFDLRSCLPCVTSNMGGWLSHMFMLKHGTLISMWPLIHLEILFVDNVVGLRSFLFKGCMKQAVSFIFLILAVFCQSERKEMHDDQELPVTSIGFRFSGLQLLEKQLVFTYYNFSALVNSKWSYLDRKLKKHCVLTMKLPPSECTFDNITALQNGSSQLSLTNVTLEPSSVVNLWKPSTQHATHMSSWPCAKLTQLAFESNGKFGRHPSFSLSCAAAPTFFLSLHLRLLMEWSTLTSGFRDQDLVFSIDHPENVATVLSPSLGGNSLVLPSGSSELDTCPVVDLGAENVSLDLAEEMITKPSHSSQDFPENDSAPPLEKGKAQLSEDEQRLSAQSFDPDNLICKVDDMIKGCHLNLMTVDIQSYDPVAKDTDTDVQNIQRTIDLVSDTNDGDHGLCSPNPAASQSLRGSSRNGNSFSSASANLSPGWYDRKQDFLWSGFGHGPKKPRTQVSYSLPLGGKDYNSKSKFHYSKGFSHKRIRRASEKKTSETYGTSQRNIEMGCKANVLVTVGDRGWREFGAKVVLELFYHNEWRLAVKVSGDTKYSYKAHQFVQPGTTNRYTHAMMWRGGKDWVLEFLDRSQWSTFKEMHEECYNRNFRAASIKNIPIPGVRLIEENDDYVPDIPYLRPSPKYHCQDETDIDIAMNRSRVLYDMDSDDERWITKRRGLDFNESGCGDVSDEMFERTIDVLEKFAFLQQCDDFTLDELEDATSEIGSLEAIKIIYEHWREKRQKKGMPLVRHLQPPLWEKYQQQVKEWEQAVAKSNLSLTGGCQEKALNVEKPPMFAFCLKPRGLEMPSRGSKQRSQKKLSVGALGKGIPGDSDAYHSQVGRRSNGFVLGDDRVVCTAYNQGTSDSSPVLQGLTRMFSPRDSGAAGYFSLSSDGYERSRYPKPHRNKSKKLSSISSANDQSPVASYIQRTPGKKSSAHLWSSSEWPSQMHYHLEGFHQHKIGDLDPAELDEFRLRDASSAARHAKIIAKMRRERARRMLCRADLAKHKASTAIMTAEAVKASYRNPSSDVELSG